MNKFNGIQGVLDTIFIKAYSGSHSCEVHKGGQDGWQTRAFLNYPLPHAYSEMLYLILRLENVVVNYKPYRFYP
jgi:hypothetical protein